MACPERLAIRCCVFAFTSGDLSQRIQSGGDCGLVARAGPDSGQDVAHRCGLFGERDAHDGVVAGQVGPPGHKGNAESAGDQGGAQVPFVGVVGDVGGEAGAGAGQQYELVVGGAGCADDPGVPRGLGQRDARADGERVDAGDQQVQGFAVEHVLVECGIVGGGHARCRDDDRDVDIPCRQQAERTFGLGLADQHAQVWIFLL